MTRLIGALLLLVVGGAAAAAHGDEPRSAVVKKKAQEVGEALKKDDYAKVVDLTYPKVVELMGGREKMIIALTDGMKQLKEKGFSFRSVKVGEPAEFVAGEKDTFVVVPTTTEMTAPGGKITVKSYLLGISSDGGKVWTFVDGNGIGTVERREKILPKLPEKLKLPEPHEPEFIKEG
jgi:hypothetical protein